MLALVGRTLQFAFLHLLIRIVDRISRLPRNSQPSDLERLYRENIGLKAELEALRKELKNKVGKRPRLSLRARAAQVLAHLLNRSNKHFQKHYLGSSRSTVKHWAARFRRSLWFWRAAKEPRPAGGLPTTADEVRTLVIRFRLENPRWGVPKIQGALRELGIRVSKSTVRDILVDEGLLPSDPRPANWDRFRSSAKDALWALDYFVTEIGKGVKVKVLLIIDVYTRELMDLRVHDGWAVDSQWTTMSLNTCIRRTWRMPDAIMHDREHVFDDHLTRQLAVLGIERRRTPPRQPLANIFAERAVLTVRWELLNHIRVNDAEELQWYLDQYRTWYNELRVHDGIDARPPARYARGEAPAEIVSIEELRQRRLVRHQFAHGLLNGYELVAGTPEDDEEEARCRGAA